MADFVAVIRRTVDGLSDNVPEMRAKVYDKARGAVRRQLESMKPRPSDEMIDRQMGKVEAAISQVEGDYAEALAPVEETPAPEPFIEAPVVIETPVPQPTAALPAPDPPPAEEQGPARDEEAADLLPQEAEQPSPAQSAPVTEDLDAVSEPEVSVLDARAADDLPVPQDHVAPVAAPEWPAQEDLAEQGPDDTADVYSWERPPEQALTASSTAEWNERPLHPDVSEAVDPFADAVEDDQDRAGGVSGRLPDADADRRRDQAFADPFATEAAVEEGPPPGSVESGEAEEEPGVAPAAADANLPRADLWELPEWSDPAPAAAITAHVEPVRSEAANVVEIVDPLPDLTDYDVAAGHSAMRPAEDGVNGPDPSHSWAWDETDPFAQATGTQATGAQAPGRHADGIQKGALAAGAAPVEDWSWPVEKPAESTAIPPGNDWDDIDDLLLPAGQQPADPRSALHPAEMAAPERRPSYRARPKRKAHLARLGGALLLLVALGGGGYAYWQNRDQVNTWVSTLAASVMSSPAVPQKNAPQSTEPVKTTAPVEASDKPTVAANPPQQDVASLETGAKFTQRLQPDGTEINTGPAPLPAGDTLQQEGKSVAGQTEASRAPEPATTEPVVPADTVQPPPAQPTPAQPVDAAANQIPPGAQKMFLYEERLGQSAPTAISGNVVWSLKEESAQQGVRPEPVIQAQITVPERGLTALITIKRNTDTSLPASHVIEFVFSLPENFPGGSVDSVQRVSMKRNEQDRGDALIAVPAKITDDFHMIALNDFPEAVATNTDLLRSRGWLDIPLTYRNGRRALLTLEKGAAGGDAFTKALQAWSTLPKAAQAQE